MTTAIQETVHHDSQSAFLLMARQRHLVRAPIREALLDVRIGLLPPEVLPILDEMARGIPDVERIDEMQAFSEQIHIADGGRTRRVDSSAEALGYRVVSDDGRFVLQLRRNGMTLSRLAPYSTWDEILDRARVLWTEHFSELEFSHATRLGVRYMNHLRLPHPVHEIEDYFTSLPRLPQALPQQMTSFLSRVSVWDDESQLSAHVTHALLDDVDPDRIGVALDIDAYSEGLVSKTDPGIWETLDRLRRFKNLIFFESITERTAERYE